MRRFVDICAILSPMTPRQRGWLAAAAFWAVFGLVSGLQVWMSMILHGHSVVRLVGYYLFVWEAWLLITVVIVKLTERMPLIPFNGRNLLAHFLAATVLGVAHLSYWMMLELALRPYDIRTLTILIAVLNASPARSRTRRNVVTSRLSSNPAFAST